MRWIGQHIWDLTSRFRNDVYLEDLTELDQEFSVMVDADGKLTKSSHPGERSRIQVRNDEGSTIPAGAPLYSKGEIGGSERILVGICVSSDPAKMPCIGVAEFEMNTTDTKDSFAVTQGVYNTNIHGFTGLTVGDTLYVNGGVAPHLTPTKPTNGDLIQNVGIVLKTNGTICQGLLVSAIGRTNDVPWPLYVDDTNQRVGIGTTSPAYKLSVNGDVQSDFFRGYTYPTGSYLDFDDDTLPGTNGTALVSVSSMKFIVDSNNNGSADAFSWIVDGLPGSGTTLMTLLDEGNLGIGTSSPTSKLHVIGDTRIEGDLTVNGTYTQIDTDVNTTEQWLVTNDGTGPAAVINQLGSQDIFDVQDDGTSVFYIEDGGQIGIGTTNPTARLHIESADDVVVRLKSTDNKAYIALSDNDTDGYISSENSRLSLGAYPNVHANNLNIDLSNNNVGIGTSSPSEKLEVSGKILATGGQIRAGSYLESYPSFSFADDIDTGMFSDTADQLEFVTGGTSRVIIDSSGNVGIGHSSPVSNLHIYENSVDTNSAAGLTIEQAGTGDALAQFLLSGQRRWVVGADNSDADKFKIASSIDLASDAYLTIDTAGKVGIGTTNPSSRLDVNGIGTFNQVRIGDSTTTNYGLIVNYADTRLLQLKRGGNTAFRVIADSSDGQVDIYDNSGNSDIRLHADNDSYITNNLGIGTTSPSYKLDVNGTSRVAGTIHMYGSVRNYSGDFSLHNAHQDSDILFKVNGGGTTTTAMMIDGATSNVGIGTTSPSEKLEVDGNISLSADSFLKTSNNNLNFIELYNGSDASMRFRMGHATVGRFQFLNNSDTEVFTIDARNEKVGIGTSSPSEKLEVNGNVQATSYKISGATILSGAANVSLGSSGATGTISLNTHTSTALYVAGDDNVGIGTTSPSSKLDVNGEIKSDKTANGVSFSSTGGGLTFTAFDVYTATNGGLLRLYNESTQTVNIDGRSANGHTYFNNGGNVGIGTTSPTHKLEVRGGDVHFENASSSNTFFDVKGSSANGYIRAYSDSNSVWLYQGGSNSYLQAQSGSTLRLGSGTANVVISDTSGEVMRTSSGNVGIGTTSPSEKLEVDGNIKIGDNQRIAFGSGDDLRITHDSTNSYIQNFTGHLNITNQADDSDIIFSSDDGAGGVATYFKLDGDLGINRIYKALRADDNVQIQVGTSAHGISLVHDGSNSTMSNAIGDLTITNFQNDGDIIFKSDDGTGSTTEYFRVDGTNEQVVFSKNLKLQDNDKLRIGDANDLEISHDSFDTYVNNFTGNLYIVNRADDKDIIFQSDDGLGGVTEYFRLNGGYTSPYTVFPDNSTLCIGTGLDLRFLHNGSNSFIDQTGAGDLYIRQKNNDKDIIFQSDDGSGDVATYFQLDGSLADGSNYYTKWPDNSVASFGSAPDLLIYHDGTNSRIRNITTSNLVIENLGDDKDIIFKSDDGTGSTTEYFRVDGGDERVVFSKEARLNDNVGLKLGSAGDLHMYHDGSNSYMRQISSGNLYIDQLVDDSDIVLRSDDGSGGLATYLQLDGSSVRTRAFKDVNFDDSVKATFGASSDLQIYHDGSNSFIVDAGTGDLLNYFSNEWKVIKYGSSETCIEATSDGSVDLYYDNSKKFETTSTGVEVTGNISLTGSVQKQIQVFPMNFVDDLGTDKHFMPFVTNTEQTVNYQEEAAMVMPADGRVVSVTVHYAQMDGTDGNITVGIETSACGQSYANPWTVEETETIAASVTDDHHVFHFAFDNAKHFESTDKMAISIQQSTDMQSAARFFWVTAVIEYDWSTFLGGTSAEYTTTP